MAKKNGSALAILALIIGIGAIGIGGYNIYYVQTNEPSETIGNTWYRANSTYYPTDPTGNYIPISGLTIEFNIISGQSAYFLYNGIVSLRLPGEGFAWVEVYFSLDGSRITSPFTEVLIHYDAYMIGSPYRDSVSLQYSDSALGPGTHEITIIIRGNSNLNAITESTLFVQTYSS
ncbi:MAG: hypothetical protein ACFE9Z_16850 [Promethearchaeota archaeon]